MSGLRILTVVLCSCLLLCNGYKLYQEDIPNGNNVPHPCKPNYIWKGVGHQNLLGGGVRNPFGLAFKTAGKTWNKTLCEEDSDGDGRTNGEELGDPNCVWTKGDVPQNVTGLSHPGVCEPTDSKECIAKNPWEVDCSGAEFVCEGLDDPDVINITLKLDKTLVPAQETTYICQSFKLPDDQEYHLIASKPTISNAYVMHHMLLNGCPNDIDGFETPKICGMARAECRKLITTWTLGLSGHCLINDTGIQVGKGHVTTVVMQLHWNNPTAVDNYYDETSVTLYLTPKLRKNNLSFLITGQAYLELPPGLNQYTSSGVCPGTCVSKKLSEPLYIVSASIHMHYLGISGQIEQWRDGKLLNTWFSTQSYSYDSPVANRFNPPVEFLPGDDIITNCTYNTMSKNTITYQGDATSDEMCFGFMKFYPAEANFDQCFAYKDKDFCQLEPLLNARINSTGGSARHPVGGEARDPTGGAAKDPTGGTAKDPTGGTAKDPIGGSARQVPPHAIILAVIFFFVYY